MDNQHVQVTPYTDPLMERYNELALTTEIQDIKTYAEEWQKLGNTAYLQGRPALGDMCIKRAEYYAQQEDGSYRREIIGSFSTLEQT